MISAFLVFRRKKKENKVTGKKKGKSKWGKKFKKGYKKQHNDEPGLDDEAHSLISPPLAASTPCSSAGTLDATASPPSGIDDRRKEAADDGKFNDDASADLSRTLLLAAGQAYFFDAEQSLEQEEEGAAGSGGPAAAAAAAGADDVPAGATGVGAPAEADPTKADDVPAEGAEAEAEADVGFLARAADLLLDGAAAADPTEEANDVPTGADVGFVQRAADSGGADSDRAADLSSVAAESSFRSCSSRQPPGGGSGRAKEKERRDANETQEEVGRDDEDGGDEEEEEEEKPPPVPVVSMVCGTFCSAGVVRVDRRAPGSLASSAAEPVSPLGATRSRSDDDISCVSSVSASSFRTALDDDDVSLGYMSVVDAGGPSVSFQVAAGGGSPNPGASGAARSVVSASTGVNSYATALSRMSSKTDRIFVSMPRRLIRSGLLTQALSVLGDDRYVLQRIQKLGVVLAAELMTSDCDCLSRRAHKLRDVPKVGRMDGIVPTKSDSSRSLTSAASFMDGFNGGGGGGTTARILALFDTFQVHVVSSCRQYLVHTCSVKAMGYSSSNDQAALPESLATVAAMSPTEGGRALSMLGASLDRRGVFDKAMSYYRHALGLFLAQVGDVGLQLFDDTRRELGLGPGVNYETIGDSAVLLGGAEDDEDGVDGQQKGKLEYLDIGRTLTYVGDLHAKAGQLDDALKAYHAALAHLECAVVCFKADARAMRSVASEKAGGAGGGEIKDGDAESAAIDLVTTARTEFLWTLFRIGTAHGERNDVTSAIAVYQRALMLEASLFGHDTKEVADTHYNLGSLYSRAGNLDEALRHYEEALHIRRSIFGGSHVDVARTLYNVGGVHRRRREFGRAVACFREIMDAQEDALGRDHPMVKLTAISLAATLRQSGEKEEASRLCNIASDTQS